jgi:hypothetical protein
MQLTLKCHLDLQDLKDHKEIKIGHKMDGINGTTEPNGEMEVMIGTITNGEIVINGKMIGTIINGEMELNGEMEANGITEVKDLKDGLPMAGINGTTEPNGEMEVMIGTTLNGEMEANGEAKMTKVGTTLNGEMEAKDGTTLCHILKMMPPIKHLHESLITDSLIKI